MKQNEQNTTLPQKYFASANGGNGFESYFDKIFDNSLFDRIYILKGGPGTGKSSIMKKMCENALNYGAICEQVLCSSDPDSLDGILIKSSKGRMAILDGTAPHTRDTLAPGAIDEIIDLGRFWDSDELAKHRSDILKLQNQKREAYVNAYSILSSALGYLKRKNEILKSCLDKQKLEKAVQRIFANKNNLPSSPKIQYKLSRAISAKGAFSCNLYENMYEMSIGVYGMHGGAFAVLDEIRNYSKINKKSITLSPTPLCRDIYDAIAVDSNKISFYDAGKYKPANSNKTINSERFLSEQKLRESKPTMRTLTKLYEDSMEYAYKELAKTRTYHFGLEDIYTSAMKFDQMNIVNQYISEKIKAFCT